MHDHTFRQPNYHHDLGPFWLWFLLCNYLLLESQSSCSLCPMPLLFAEHLAKGDQIEVKNRNGIRLYMSCKYKLAQTKTLKAVKVRELVQPHEAHEPARAHGHSRPVLSNWPSISMQNLAEAWHRVAECKKSFTDSSTPFSSLLSHKVFRSFQAFRVHILATLPPAWQERHLAMPSCLHALQKSVPQEPKSRRSVVWSSNPQIALACRSSCALKPSDNLSYLVVLLQFDLCLSGLSFCLVFVFVLCQVYVYIWSILFDSCATQEVFT